MVRKYSFKVPAIRLIDCYSLVQLPVSNIASLRSWELTSQKRQFLIKTKTVLSNFMKF